MYGHLGLPQTWVPTNLTRSGERPWPDSAPRERLAIGFGWAIALATITMVLGAAVLTVLLTP